jgi:hypothetical protein
MYVCIMLDAGYDQLDHLYVCMYASCWMLDMISWIIFMYVCTHHVDAGYDQLDHVYVFCICIMLDAWTMYLYMYQVDTLYDQVDHVW